MDKPEVTRCGFLDMQVCVPKEFTDEQVKEFADANNPSGLEAGWMIRKQDDESLNGDPERAQCEKREGCVHIMLGA